MGYYKNISTGSKAYKKNYVNAQIFWGDVEPLDRRVYHKIKKDRIANFESFLLNGIRPNYINYYECADRSFIERKYYCPVSNSYILPTARKI